jgi:hypothetical protein
MSILRTALGRLLLIGLAAPVGALVGVFLVAAEVLPLPLPAPRTMHLPLPHHVPKEPDGVSLRFAMVQDVLHERFARHGRAYYTERNRRVRKDLQRLRDEAGAGQPSAETYFPLLDDLGAGLDYLGNHDEAVDVLRDKLRKQEARGLHGRDTYTTYANLGTFLIHGSFRQAQQSDAAAKGRLREGLGFIHKAIEVNPQAHFGREIWQAVAVEYFLAALDDRGLLLRFDLVGDRLDKNIDPQKRRCLGDPGGMGDVDEDAWVRYGMGRSAAVYLNYPGDFGPSESHDPNTFRQYITHVGAEEGWKKAVKTSHQETVPFDEPTLGITGMWRLGGGANPHFALALGEMMLRVGQRYLAWAAYERASRMADRYWPDASIRKQFVAHCRKRQALLEAGMPEDERSRLQTAFESDLDVGRRYQHASQQYEADRIAAGASLDDPHFYDAFHAAHGSIASRVGPEDSYVVQLSDPFIRLRESGALALLFAGLFSFVTALLLRFLAPDWG